MIENELQTNKGSSLLTLVDDYTVIDIETTGLSTDFDSIIELSALKVRNKEVIDKFTSLVNPEREISEFITQLTGIGNDMVASAPTIQEIMPQYLDFISDDILVGHNVNFDVKFIYNNSKGLLINDFIDTMRISRKVLPCLKHHRLSDLANEFNIDYTGAHRSLVDCEITAKCFEHLKTKVQEEGIDLRSSKKHIKAADITACTAIFDETAPIYNKVCVFTGDMSKPRQELMQMVADAGGINGDSVTKKTNYLVLGDYSNTYGVKDGKTSKLKKAEGLILKGQELYIISEKEFYELFQGADEHGTVNV